MTDKHAESAIAFVVSHPDDVSFSMGGTAALLKRRHKLHVICVCQGERGYKGDGTGPPPPNWDLGAQRVAEEQASCDLLGAELTVLDEPDGEIAAGRAVCERVAELLGEIKPVAVFTMGPLAKPDHAATCQIARQAMHLAGMLWETELYMCESLRHANIFVNTTDVIEEKKAQAFCHQHHLHDASYWDKLLAEDRTAGRLACCEYAEPYLSEFPLAGSRWGRKAGSILMDLAPDEEGKA
jgi:LmbE family N-acetylglucosaminyl deacetylase